MLGSDAILRALEHEGVDVAFGIPGGAILPTYDAIARGTTVRHVLARHEQGAGHMAEGYARASGKVGVAIATSGPGATNLVTAIADAWMDSTPTVFITGQVPSHLIGTDAFQETDITGITMPIVKHSWLVQDVAELPSVMKAAFHIARTGRPGPVLVDVAKDVQEAQIDFSYPDDVDLPGWKPPSKVHPRQIREAAKAIVEAKRPIIYAGGGVLNADACAELLHLVDSAHLPSVVTLMGKGCLPDSHPLNYGPPGMHGSKYGNWALNKSDLVIAIGTRFDDRVTGKVSAFAPGAKVIHFDIDAAEVGKIRHADIPVVGPLKLGLAQLAAEVSAVAADGAPDHGPWLRQLEDWREQFPYRYTKVEGILKPQTAVEALRDAAAGLDHDVIWTTGVGQHQMWAMQYLVCDKPRSFITSGGLGTMGYGLPAAIGAKAARPDATVVCIDGDGCFQMTCQELATAALEGLPVVTAILNNGWLGMVRQWQEMFYAERFAQTHLTHAVPDYAQLAEAYGCAGFTVESEDQLEETLQAAFTAGRSAVIDVRCDPEEKVFPMVPSGAAAVDTIESAEEGAFATGAVDLAEAHKERKCRLGRRWSGNEHAHHLGTAGEQARCTGPRLAALLAARLQHPEPRGRPDRTCGHLPSDPARRHRRALARADREADAQARERAPRDRALSRRLARARARVDHSQLGSRAAGRARRAHAGRRRGCRRYRPRRNHLRSRRTPGSGRGVRRARPPLWRP